MGHMWEGAEVVKLLAMDLLGLKCLLTQHTYSDRNVEGIAGHTIQALNNIIFRQIFQLVCVIKLAPTLVTLQMSEQFHLRVSKGEKKMQ